MRCSGLRLLGPARRMELVVQPVFARVVEVGVVLRRCQGDGDGFSDLDPAKLWKAETC